MPDGIGTYGSKRGRPPKGKAKRKVKKAANFMDPTNLMSGLSKRSSPALGRAKVKKVAKKNGKKTRRKAK